MQMRYFFLYFVLILSACNTADANPGEKFTPMPEPALTPTDLDIATSLPEVTASAMPEITPVGEATLAPQTSGFSPVLFGKNFGYTIFLLLGGVDEGEWLSPDIAASRITEKTEYDIYSSSGSSLIEGGVPKRSQTCNDYFIETDANIADSGFVGVAQGWQVTQRNVDELSSENEFYQVVVSQWLIDRGISDPVIENLRVLRVDIEGDGVDEVFIDASYFNDESGHMIESGDYTVILMRKVNGDDVVTLDLVGNVYPSQEPEMTFPVTYSLANFMDLSQDGKLEVIIDIKRWEGFGAAVYQIDGLDRVQVLQAFCGS